MYSFSKLGTCLGLSAGRRLAYFSTSCLEESGIAVQDCNIVCACVCVCVHAYVCVCVCTRMCVCVCVSKTVSEFITEWALLSA